VSLPCATADLYTLSLHDALPIYGPVTGPFRRDVMVWFMLVAGLVLLIIGADVLVRGAARLAAAFGVPALVIGLTVVAFGTSAPRSEEHTSELQSRENLVCRLLLE